VHSQSESATTPLLLLPPACPQPCPALLAAASAQLKIRQRCIDSQQISSIGYNPSGQSTHHVITHRQRLTEPCISLFHASFFPGGCERVSRLAAQLRFHCIAVCIHSTTALSLGAGLCCAEAPVSVCHQAQHSNSELASGGARSLNPFLHSFIHPSSHPSASASPRFLSLLITATTAVTPTILSWVSHHTLRSRHAANRRSV